MFRLGGQAKIPGYQNSNYQDLLKQIRQDLSRRTENRDQYLKGIKRVLPLSVLASSSGIGQIRKPMDVVNLLSEIGTNPRTYEALMKSKSIDMKMDEGALKDKLSLAKLIKPDTSFSEKVYSMKKRDLLENFNGPEVVIASSFFLSCSLTNDSGTSHMLSFGSKFLYKIIGPTTTKFTPKKNNFIIIDSKDFHSRDVNTIKSDYVISKIVKYIYL